MKQQAKTVRAPDLLYGILQASYLERMQLELIKGEWLMEPLSGNNYLVKKLGDKWFVTDIGANYKAGGEYGDC